MTEALRQPVDAAHAPQTPQFGGRIRELRRKAGLTLQTLADQAGISVGFLSQVERDKATPSLGHLGRRARAKAVSGAFRATQRVTGCHIILIDDVFTTGATAAGCARALKKAGAARVDVLCWARVCRDLSG